MTAVNRRHERLDTVTDIIVNEIVDWAICERLGPSMEKAGGLMKNAGINEKGGDQGERRG